MTGTHTVKYQFAHTFCEDMNRILVHFIPFDGPVHGAQYELPDRRNGNVVSQGAIVFGILQKAAPYPGIGGTQLTVWGARFIRQHRIVPDIGGSEVAVGQKIGQVGFDKQSEGLAKFFGALLCRADDFADLLVKLPHTKFENLAQNLVLGLEMIVDASGFYP